MDPRLSYRHSQTRRNIPGLRDTALLRAFEREKVEARREELANGDLEKFAPNLDGLTRIHHHLFQDLYATAGKLRGERVSVDGESFVPTFEGKLAPAMDTAARREVQGYSENLSDALASGSFGEEARVSVMPTLSKIVGAFSRLEPFHEGNGRATKAFVEQTLRAFGLAANTRDISQAQWANATRLAGEGRASTLTRLLRSKAVPLEADVFSQAPRKVVAAPVESAKGGLTKDVRDPIGAVVAAAREHGLATGSRDAELARMRTALLSAIRQDIPLFGDAADPRLGPAYASNPTLRGEAIIAQSALETMTETKALYGRSESERLAAEAAQSPEAQLADAMGHLKDRAESNLYLKELLEGFAAMNINFARGYYSAKRITRWALAPVVARAQLSQAQLDAAVAASPAVTSARASLEDAAGQVYAQPKAALSAIREATVRSGSLDATLQELVDSPSTFGRTVPFRRGLLGRKDKVGEFRAVDALKHAVRDALTLEMREAERLRSQDLAARTELAKGLEVPSEDLQKTLAANERAKGHLKALPEGVDRTRLAKEMEQVRSRIEARTQLFGQALPGVSDAKIAAFREQRSRVKSLQTNVLDRSLGAGRGLAR